MGRGPESVRLLMGRPGTKKAGGARRAVVDRQSTHFDFKVRHARGVKDFDDICCSAEAKLAGYKKGRHDGRPHFLTANKNL